MEAAARTVAFTARFERRLPCRDTKMFEMVPLLLDVAEPPDGFDQYLWVLVVGIVGLFGSFSAVLWWILRENRKREEALQSVLANRSARLDAIQDKTLEVLQQVSTHMALMTRSIEEVEGSITELVRSQPR